MTEDIFDRVEGYEQFHEILNILNKLMIETEKLDNISRGREWAEIQFKVKTQNEIADLETIEWESERDIPNNKEIIRIIFNGK